MIVKSSKVEDDLVLSVQKRRANEQRDVISHMLTTVSLLCPKFDMTLLIIAQLITSIGDKYQQTWRPLPWSTRANLDSETARHCPFSFPKARILLFLLLHQPHQFPEELRRAIKVGGNLRKLI